MRSSAIGMALAAILSISLTSCAPGVREVTVPQTNLLIADTEPIQDDAGNEWVPVKSLTPSRKMELQQECSDTLDETYGSFIFEHGIEDHVSRFCSVSYPAIFERVAMIADSPALTSPDKESLSQLRDTLLNSLGSPYADDPVVSILDTYDLSIELSGDHSVEMTQGKGTIKYEGPRIVNVSLAMPFAQVQAYSQRDGATIPQQLIVALESDAWDVCISGRFRVDTAPGIKMNDNPYMTVCSDQNGDTYLMITGKTLDYSEA